MAGMIDQMFADARSTGDRADRLEMLKEALNASREQGAAGRGRFVMKDGQNFQTIGGAGQAERYAALRGQFEGFSKSLDAGQQAEVNAALAELDAMSKDITAGAYPAVGSPGNLRPYDLEAPAKILVPRFTPLLNETPRVKGQGGAREYRRILGYTNSGMGGVPDADIFFNSETASTTFGGVSGLRRGNKISYAMDVHTVAYVEASVSDSVTDKAVFSNMGFENVLDLSHMAMLWAHKLGEEKALLFGRGNSSQGYAGPIGTTVNLVTIAAATAANARGAASYTAFLTQRSGVGESAQGTGPTAVACSGTQGLAVTLPALPAGVYGFNVYIGTSTGDATFAGFSPVGGTTVTLAIPPLAANGGIALNTGTDTSASNGYDGLLTVLTNSQLSGWVGTGGSYSSIATTGDKFIQDGCMALYQGVYADPDEVWLNVVQSRLLGDYLKSQPSATATSFRIEVDNGGAIIGSNVTGVYNQSSPTRKMLDLRVHPYMPVGCSILRSRTLDIPDSGVGDTSQIVSVQEYMAVDWPRIQFTRDASTYWLGTYVHYAPAWSGAITALPST